MLAAVKEWAKKQTYIVALVAPEIIASVRDFHVDYQHIKFWKFGSKQYKQPYLPSWFIRYRSHRKWLNFQKELFANVLGPEVVQGFCEIQAEILKIKWDKESIIENKPTPEEWAEIKQFLHELLEASYRDVEDEFLDKPLDEDTQAALKKLIAENPLDSSLSLQFEISKIS